jgi:hypothetical protein
MLRLQCKPFQVGLGFYQDVFRLFIGVQGSICVQDFSTLKWLRVISPMSLHFHLESPGGSKPSELDFAIGRDFSPKLKHVDSLNLPLELNVDKTSLLALHYAVTKMLNNLWGPRPKLDRVLKWRSNRSRALRKLRYVIENRTGRVVWFGQHASPESVRGVRARSARLSIKSLEHRRSNAHSNVTKNLTRASRSNTGTSGVRIDQGIQSLAHDSNAKSRKVRFTSFRTRDRGTKTIFVVGSD